MSDVDRFVPELVDHLDDVVAELTAGRKESHWMWFMFPQLRSLGRSDRARHFGLADLDEACAYLTDPRLGPEFERLVSIVHTAVVVRGRTVHDVFAFDDVKLVSSLTLFRAVGEREGRVDLVRECTEILEAAWAQGLGPCEVTSAHVRDATGG